MTTSVSLKPMSVFMAFTSLASLIGYADCSGNTHPLTRCASEASCTGLVPQICRCFPKSNRSLQWLPCHLKYLLDREERVGFSLGKAKPPLQLGRDQRKMSQYCIINPENMKVTSQNYGAQPSWYTFLGGKSCLHREVTWVQAWSTATAHACGLLGKTSLSYTCHGNV